MLSWADPEWPEDYYRVLDELEVAGASLQEAEMMRDEANAKTRPFWHHQVQSRRMAIQQLEAQVRQHKQNATYPNLYAESLRMTQP